MFQQLSIALSTYCCPKVLLSETESVSCAVADNTIKAHFYLDYNLGLSYQLTLNARWGESIYTTIAVHSTDGECLLKYLVNSYYGNVYLRSEVNVIC